MTKEDLRGVLGWCTVINFGLLMLWFFGFLVFHDVVYQIHSSMFKLSPERFDEINYSLMGYYKLSIFFFNLMPYIALRIIQGSRSKVVSSAERAANRP